MKKTPLILLGLASAMALVACAGGTTSNVDQSLPTDDPTTETEIIFWHCLGQAKTDNLTKIIDKFNEEYAGKYKVTGVHVAGNYDSLHDTVKKKLASGEIPALTMGYPDSFAEYISSDINESSILRLDNFIQDENYGYSSEELNDFIEGYYSEGTSYQFTGTWSMPMYKSTEVMYYNLSYFKGVNECNVAKFSKDAALAGQFNQLYTPVKGTTTATDAQLDALEAFCKTNGGYTYSVPSTWEEMIALSRQMKADREANGITTEFYPLGYDSDANLLISQFKQRGIDYTYNGSECDDDPSLHFTFNNPQAKAVVNEMVGYINDKIMVTKGSLGGNTYTNILFNAAKLAMTVGSTGGSSYNISSNFRVAIAPVPYSGSKPYYIQQGPSICFFDNENSYIHKGAWLFYKALADVDNNTALALQNSYDPIRKSCYATKNYTDWTALHGQGLCYDIPFVTATLQDKYFTSETFIGSSTARSEIGNVIKYVTNMAYTVDQAFEYAYNSCV